MGKEHSNTDLHQSDTRVHVAWLTLSSTLLFLFVVVAAVALVAAPQLRKVVEPSSAFLQQHMVPATRHATAAGAAKLEATMLIARESSVHSTRRPYLHHLPPPASASGQSVRTFVSCSAGNQQPALSSSHVCQRRIYIAPQPCLLRDPSFEQRPIAAAFEGGRWLSRSPSWLLDSYTLRCAVLSGAWCLADRCYLVGCQAMGENKNICILWQRRTALCFLWKWRTALRFRWQRRTALCFRCQRRPVHQARCRYQGLEKIGSLGDLGKQSTSMQAMDVHTMTTESVIGECCDWSDNDDKGTLRSDSARLSSSRPSCTKSTDRKQKRLERFLE